MQSKRSGSMSTGQFAIPPLVSEKEVSTLEKEIKVGQEETSVISPILLKHPYFQNLQQNRASNGKIKTLNKLLKEANSRDGR